MTADELDEIVKHLENARYVGAYKAAAMLRQQQADIELLEAKRMMAYNIGYEDGRKAQKE